jgi:hypothetical protein
MCHQPFRHEQEFLDNAFTKNDPNDPRSVAFTA